MPRTNADFLFALFETQRMLRLYADKLAVRHGITRAQWAVLAKLERTEGLKQSELADMMEMQPITLTRLIDRLCNNDLIERREDPKDRRANRLYLRPAARLGKRGVDDGTGLGEREGHAAISCRAVPAISASRRAISSAGAPVPKT